MSLHAIEITLVRPAVKKELKAARRESRLPLAASADQVRLLTVICAANRQAALRGVWAALENLLPIDALWTAYADKDGMHLLSVQVSEEVQARVQDAAAVAGQDPDEYVKQSLLDAVARDQADTDARLDAVLDRLVAEFTPEQITAAAARRIAPQAGVATARG
ncbi:hypothetical protein [Streptomyces sp. NBC_00038]|uniref:hypothetical protein n=1 Tax=Streptomyces sp. NBC_00038 TaxID=2903615 RepID=UPI00224D9F97|nr:hypothetical protein [Streptomyces sp. NBC_00038]MCX5558390.1 hypothetical protein [Streptomyces sp. NBC_00038]